MHERLVAQPVQHGRHVEEPLQAASGVRHHPGVFVVRRNLHPIDRGQVIRAVVMGIEDLAQPSHGPRHGDVVSEAQRLEQLAVAHAPGELGQDRIGARAVRLDRLLEGMVVEVEELAHGWHLARQQPGHARRRARLWAELAEAAEQRTHHRLRGADGLVQVDLPIHVEPPEEEAFHRGEPLLAVDRHAGTLFTRGHHQAHRLQQPVEVEYAVAHSRHVGVAE